MWRGCIPSNKGNPLGGPYVQHLNPKQSREKHQESAAGRHIVGNLAILIADYQRTIITPIWLALFIHVNCMEVLTTKYFRSVNRLFNLKVTF